MGGFKKFMLRGNLVELAVAVVIGVAFGAVITALVADLITPLIAAIGDSDVKVTPVQPIRPIAVPPPLDPNIIGPAEGLVAKYFPGVPLIPSMSTGATDGIFLEAIGIPVYGAPGGWGDPDGNGAHGLNERRSVRSVYIGRDFLTDLVKLYADQP